VTNQRRVLMRLLLTVPFAAAALVACGSDETTGGDGPTPTPGYEDVELYGEVTDEALAAFTAALGAGITEDATRAAVLDVPTEGQVIPSDPVPQFAWHFGGTSELAPEPFDAVPLRIAPSRGEAPSRVLGAFFGALGVRSAHAHGAPFNGRATFLTFATADNPKLVRIFTSQTVFQPSVQTWAKFTAATGPITVTLLSADLEQNRVILDGGPIQGGSATFTVAP